MVSLDVYSQKGSAEREKIAHVYIKIYSKTWDLVSYYDPFFIT